jgi:hypothetical protein
LCNNQKFGNWRGGDWKLWWWKSLWGLKKVEIEMLAMVKVVAIKKGDDWNVLILMIKSCFSHHKAYGNRNMSNFNHLYPCLGQPNMGFDLG